MAMNEKQNIVLCASTDDVLFWKSQTAATAMRGGRYWNLHGGSKLDPISNNLLLRSRACATACLGFCPDFGPLALDGQLLDEPLFDEPLLDVPLLDEPLLDGPFLEWAAP